MKQERRARRGEEEWIEILKEYERSGLSQKTFCRPEGLAVGSLQHWRRRLGRERGPGFVELVPSKSEAAASGWSLEIVFPNGLAVRWRG